MTVLDYDLAFAAGTDRYFHPRRTDCSWCGSTDIAPCLTTGDRFQYKPGTFVLDECASCLHVFQNPQLTGEGLELYYRDAYDNPRQDRTFALQKPFNKKRAKMALGLASPRTWLDVGTGFGHFCSTARAFWPDTRFDGLDMGDHLLTGRDRGWITEAHQGFFPDLADGLAGRYDMISMHHYLEHTVEPKAELEAAARALPCGGHLQIEVPDPRCFGARHLRKYWGGWFPPQHLQMIPVENLCEALEERGFEIVKIDWRKADQGFDFTFAASVLMGELGARRETRWARSRPLAWAAFPFAILTGLALDAMVRPFFPDRSNAYRVLAVRK